MQPLHAVVRLFVLFCVVMAFLGLLAFWPPRSPAIIGWLIVWTVLCLGTAMAIVQRARYAPFLVWSLVALAVYSAVSAFRGGMLDNVGILIDIMLGIPLVWFAIWYQRRHASSVRTEVRS